MNHPVIFRNLLAKLCRSSPALVMSVASAGLVVGCAGRAVNPDDVVTRRISETEYVLRIDKTGMEKESAVAALNSAALKACGSQDYENSLATVLDIASVPASGSLESARLLQVTNHIYCNGRFVDSRLSLSDETFAPLLALDGAMFKSINPSPQQRMIAEMRYQELEQALSDSMERLRAGSLDEDEFELMLDGFEIPDLDMAGKFDAWVAASPTSPWPYFARGIFHYGVGWMRRDGRTYDAMNSLQKTDFGARMVSALDDLRKAQALGLDIAPSQARLVSTLLGRYGAEKEISNICDKTIERHPESVVIRTACLRFKQPRWFGSNEEMQQLVDQAAPLLKKWPRLSRVEAAMHADLALQKLYDDEDPAQALYHADQAIGLEGGGRAYLLRSRALESQKRLLNAFAAAKMAANLSPYSETIYTHLVSLALATNSPLEAMQAATAAAAVSPSDPETWTRKGLVFSGFRRYTEARDAFYAAFRLAPTNGRLRHLAREANFQIDIRQAGITDSKPTGL